MFRFRMIKTHKLSLTVN